MAFKDVHACLLGTIPGARSPVINRTKIYVLVELTVQ